MREYALTNRQARRFVLRWQGLLGPRRFKGREGAAAFVRQAGCLQFDPVDLCGKNAEIVLFSRVGGFTKPMLERLLYKERRLVEHWDKNMALYPTEDWPSFARNRANFRGWSYTDESRRQVEAALDDIRRLVAKKGVLCSQDVEMDARIDWPWAPTRLARAAMEYLYFTGELCIHRRKGAVRYYTGVQKHLPPELLAADDPFESEEDYYAWHVLRRVGAVGLLWNKPSDAFLAIPEFGAQKRDAAFQRLLERGALLPCRVEGVKQTLYAPLAARELLETAAEDGPVGARMEFIAPLDSFLWDRKLVKELFGFDYKWEIYTPKEKRLYGPYVLPVLQGDKLVGRVDVKADRAAGALVANRFWPEKGQRMGKGLLRKLDGHLAKFARFNGCRRVEAAPEFAAF